MKITALIADDEPLARQRVFNLLKENNVIEVIASCKNGVDTIAKILELKPQLLFLDIKMKDMTGFDVLSNINVEKRPITIFITAYDEFALKAFDFFAFDYLLKPFKDERFYASLNKVINSFKNNEIRKSYNDKIDKLLTYISDFNNTQGKPKKTVLPIKLGNKVFFISFNDIKYIKASGYYAEIHTKDGKKHLLREPLTNLILKLSSNQFARIHRSTIINILEMQEILHSSFGEIDVKMQDGEIFRVSKSHKKSFNEILGL